jgi:hypothetical protein
MNRELLDTIPLWGLFLIACVFVLLALEGGYRLGKWRHIHASEENAAPVGVIVGSILGLLAFMLAFTFSLAATRFEARREVVLEEANAIGTTYLRARFLPEPQRTEAAKLLKEYVDVRVRGVREGKISETISKSEDLHGQMWTQATTAAENNPASIMTGLFIQSLNDVIDLHAKRVLVGVRSRIPLSIWGGLFVLTILGMASMGYQVGLSGTSRFPATLLLVLAFACVLFLIADLDRSQEGFFRVSQEAMTDLQRSMNSAQP